MSEQATNSPSAEQSAEASLFNFFGGNSDKAPAPQGDRPRDPETGKYVRTGQPEGEAQQQTEDAPAQGEEQGTEAQGQDQAQAQSEEVEVEIDGEKYLVPKKISDRFIHHADYTRKTQDVAEMRRVLSAQAESHRIEQAFTQATSQERQQMTLLDAQIEQFKNVNWQALETQDLLRTRAQLDQLKDMRAELHKAIEAKRTEFEGKVKSATQEALAAGEKYIAQRIKGYDAAKKQQLYEYGLREGYMQEELERLVDPRLVVSLWKAAQWDSLQASNPGVLKKAQQAAPVVRPGATQRQPSRVQSLNKAFQEAKTPQAKQQSAEEYFAHRLGGGR